jgi:hypothetical protein
VKLKVVMIAFLITTLIVMLALGLISYIANKRTNLRTDQTPRLSLLPGDIKYESPGGKFVFYFPITTSIVISIILTLVLHFLR